MKRLTRAWLRKADEDLRVVQRLIRDDPEARNTICFHSQQAAEKYVKGMMQELGFAIPRIHDLDKLAVLLGPKVPELSRWQRRLVQLSRYAVDYRYPNRDATARQSKSAWKLVLQIEDFVKSWLAMRSKPRRKHS